MKIIRIIFYIFVVMTFTACSSTLGVQTLTIGGVTYRRGFYDDNLMYPKDITFQKGSERVDDKTIKYVNFEPFDIVQSMRKGDTKGILYCADEQWEQAKAYYADSNHYEYYCQIGVKNVNRDLVVVALPDIDPEKFDMLLAFADENRYQPFGAKNKNTYRLPMPDKKDALLFYRESKDGFLASVKGFEFYVNNDKLVFVYYYDHGYGKYEEMVVVDVPKALGQYFIELVAHATSGQ